MCYNKVGISIVVYELTENKKNELVNRIDEYVFSGFMVSVFMNSSIDMSLVDSCILLSDENYNNRGLGYAHNRNIEALISVGCNYYITLDQDSVCLSDDIKKMYDYLLHLPKNSIVGPALNVQYNKRKIFYYDRSIKYPLKNDHSIYSVKKVIQSGMMTSIDNWLKIGKYDETLFIGEVDYEFCYRNKINGGECYCIKTVVMPHAVGCGRVGYGLFSVVLHNPVRYYYYTRNPVRLVVEKRYPFRVFCFAIIRAITVSILSPLAGKKFVCYRYVIKGLKDGFMCVKGPLCE